MGGRCVLRRVVGRTSCSGGHLERERDLGGCSRTTSAVGERRRDNRDAASSQGTATLYRSAEWMPRAARTRNTLQGSADPVLPPSRPPSRSLESPPLSRILPRPTLHAPLRTRVSFSEEAVLLPVTSRLVSLLGALTPSVVTVESPRSSLLLRLCSTPHQCSQAREQPPACYLAYRGLGSRTV